MMKNHELDFQTKHLLWDDIFNDMDKVPHLISWYSIK